MDSFDFGVCVSKWGNEDLLQIPINTFLLHSTRTAQRHNHHIRSKYLHSDYPHLIRSSHFLSFLTRSDLILLSRTYTCSQREFEGLPRFSAQESRYTQPPLRQWQPLQE